MDQCNQNMFHYCCVVYKRIHPIFIHIKALVFPINDFSAGIYVNESGVYLDPGVCFVYVAI